MRIVGERINTTESLSRWRWKNAMRLYRQEAKTRPKPGAHFIDVNAGSALAPRWTMLPGCGNRGERREKLLSP